MHLVALFSLVPYSGTRDPEYGYTDIKLRVRVCSSSHRHLTCFWLRFQVLVSRIWLVQYYLTKCMHMHVVASHNCVADGILK